MKRLEWRCILGVGCVYVAENNEWVYLKAGGRILRLTKEEFGKFVEAYQRGEFNHLRPAGLIVLEPQP